MILSLPYPPTGNHAVKHARSGAHYSTSAVRSFRSQVAAMVMAQEAPYEPLQGPLAVVVEVCPPDRRRRDLDNVWKTLADALTFAGVWGDDYQVEDLRLVRGVPCEGGRVVVAVSGFN